MMYRARRVSLVAIVWLPGFGMIFYLSTSNRANAGIYEVISPGKVIFRWQGVPCNYDEVHRVCAGGADVNFEIELNANGIIKTRYGSGNTGIFPTVGIGGGGQEAYFIPTHTSETTAINLTNAAEVTFTPRATTVSTVQLTQSSFNVNENAGSINVDVMRTGDTSSVATVKFATSDTAGPALCTAIGTTASSRCDYLTSSGKLVFAEGETAKTIAIPIINDIYTENAETFSITLTRTDRRDAGNNHNRDTDD